MKDTVPCVVFAFNRPAKLTRVLNALKEQDIDRLIVFVDGPRHENDLLSVEACRALARNVGWVEKELYLWDENHGLPGLGDNISQVMEQYPAAVIVEDDCLPVPGFYSFVRQALEHYNTVDKVFSIGGYQPIRPGYFKNYPYTLVTSARFMCWGWATWRDRWQEIRPYLARYQELFDELRHVSEVAGSDLPYVAQAMAAGKAMESWDIKVAVASLWLKKVHLLPVRGLVRNTDLVFGGMHHSLVRALPDLWLYNHNVVKQAPKKIVWLENVGLNEDYADALRVFVNQSSMLSPRRVLERGRVLMRRHIWPRRERIFDLKLIEDVATSKRALLSYIIHPFFIHRGDTRFLRNINIWHAHEIVRVLNRLGYVVDVIDYRDTGFIPDRPYDLFLSHGGINFEILARQLPASTKKIYFTTGSYWKYQNEQEKARLTDLRQRRGVVLPPDNLIGNSEEAALQLADGVIGIGNEFTRDTYAGIASAIMINGTSLYDDRLEWVPKDYEAGRQHYLFITESSNVYNGLDLLLEAFTGLEQHLWIGSRIDPKFAAMYTKELKHSANIHPIGWVQPRGRKFYQVMRKCNFCILPSCSEGQSQSVVECMNQGLIPVISHAAGLDVGDFGKWIEPCTIGRIRELVQELASWPVERCRTMSLKARAMVRSDYSEESFSAGLQAALETLLRS
jgi:glycosyltransferase involved in cell wall biosynthesis